MPLNFKDNDLGTMSDPGALAAKPVGTAGSTNPPMITLFRKQSRQPLLVCFAVTDQTTSGVN
jgi:hypothetical protein